MSIDYYIDLDWQVRLLVTTTNVVNWYIDLPITQVKECSQGKKHKIYTPPK